MLRVEIMKQDRRTQRSKQNVNIDFFKNWSPEMAYVLGYFSADGSMAINSGGSRFIYFDSTDKSLLEKIKVLTNSRHKIGTKKKAHTNKKTPYRIQIGSKEIYNDLLNLGFTPNKDQTMQLPKIPPQNLRHFTRGYFDGDGSISYGYFKRSNRKCLKSFVIITTFVSGSKNFLEALSSEIISDAGIGPGYIGRKGTAWRLAYSIKNSIRLFKYMYKDIGQEMYLVRKYNKFLEALELWGRSSAGLERQTVDLEVASSNLVAPARF